MSLKQILIFLFISFFSNLISQNDVLNRVIMPIIDPTLKFTENIGQWDDKILFRANIDGGSIFIERNGLTFNFYDKKKYRSIHHGGIASGKYKNLDIQCQAYNIKFKDCNQKPIIDKKQVGVDYENFFIGNDQKKWASDVKNYHQILLKNIYDGIDYEVITSTQGIKYNFFINANADADKINMEYDGVNSIELIDGTLLLKLDVNEIIEQKPYAYQIIDGIVKQVICNYKLNKNVVSFIFPEGYDKNYKLIIDPILVFAAQSGSSADNFGMTATYDLLGNLYSGGTIFDNGYPTTLGAFSSSFTGVVAAGITDLVITKYNATGNALIYSTYIGGSQAEIVTSLITDASNNLYLYGATSSTNFPMTQLSFDNSFNGGTFLSFQFNGTTFNNGTDIFVAKLNNTGTSLLGSTYIGGSNNDGVNYNNYAPPLHTVYPCFAPNGFNLSNEYPADSLQYNYGDQYRGEIQLDKNGFVYVASSTKSNNFPLVNAFQNSLNGKQDAVVFKLNSNLTSLIWSSYLGGSGNDAGYSLIVDDTLQTYVTGGTYSTNFPVVSGCYQTIAGGGKADGYLAKINASGNQILKATYVGTANYDQSYFVQSDRIGRIYILGQSLGTMPVSAGVYSNTSSKQFIMRFNNQLTNLNLSTVIGSGQSTIDISPSAFSVDKCSGSISLAGWGGSFINCTTLSNMPISLGAFQSLPPNGHDFYLMVLHPNFTGLKYGSYFGGNLSDEHIDGGTSRINESGVLFQSVCAGCGGNDDFPVTQGAWPNTGTNVNHSSNCNNGVFKFDYQPRITANIATNTISGCQPVTITFTNLSSPGLQYHWNLGGGAGDTTSLIYNPTKTFSLAGSYTVSLLVVENLYCFSRDSVQTVINVFQNPTANFSLTSSLCSNTISLIQSSIGNFSLNPYQWNFGNGSPTTAASSPSYTYPINGNYSISLTVTDSNGCANVKTVTISVFGFSPSVLPSSSLCFGSTTTLVASGGTSYTWTPAATLSNSLIASPIANPSASIVYTIQVLNNSPGYNCIKTLTTQLNVFPRPLANFTFSSTPCSNTITTNNLSVGNFTTNSFSWNFGNGTPLNNFNSPNYTYPINGIYTITLTVIDINGCTDLKTSTVSVLNFTTNISPNTSVCMGSSIVINASGGTNYTWTPSNSLSANYISNPIATPSIATIYSVAILNNSFGNFCSRTLTTQVNVNPSPTADFNYSLNPCGGEANFFDVSQSGIVSWNWILSPIITSSVQNPTCFYNIGGNYTVSLISTNAFGCKSKIEKVITVISAPILSISNQTLICIGSSAQLNASGGIAYQWFPSQTLDFPFSSNPKATPIIATEYSVIITTSNSILGKPCQYSLTTLVNVNQLSLLPESATANPVRLVIGNSTTLSYIGSPGLSISWFPVNSTFPTTGYTVIAFPDKSTTYTAVVTNGPCRHDLDVHVDAYSLGCIESDVFIPNTFTPNADGQNDILYVRGIKVNEMYFAIYNRWGELVFETKDKEIGWDGFYKGKPADIGVFGWYLNVKCFNGEETFKKGNLTLVR